MYTLQFGKKDVLATTLNSGATSTTIVSGNFGSPTGTQIYVVDYDVPAKAEIISATVASTNVTSITRGLSGGASGTTDHAAGAKIGSIFVPQHYDALTNGSGFATGTSSVGIPASAVKQEAWTSYVPTWTSTGSAPAIGNGTLTGKYQRIGNTVRFIIKLVAGSTTTLGTGVYYLGLPLPMETTLGTDYLPIGTASISDAGSNSYNANVETRATDKIVLPFTVTGNTYQTIWQNTSPFTFGNTDYVLASGTYEAA